MNDLWSMFLPKEGSAKLKFSEMPWWGWVVLIVLILGGVALLAVLSKRKGGKKWSPRMLAMGAVCMALASVLSMVRLGKMPMGGSITPASMLPLMLFAYIYGTVPGILLGVVYGLMQFILDGGSAAAYGVVPMLLDYPIAFGLIGLTGLARGIKNPMAGLATGAVLGSVGRYLSSFVSGWVFYGSASAEYGLTPVVYSIIYNAAYMLPECIICVALAVLAGPRLVRELRTLTHGRELRLLS